jgi:biopolymer transport protein ExbD
MASSSVVKRRRKLKRIDTDGDPEFQVAPMVDVLLVLMLFFMAITSTEVLKNDKKVDLPQATHAKPNEDNPNHKHEITINVEWNPYSQSALYILGSTSSPTPDGLAAVIASKHAADPAGYVVIRADKDVEYSSVADLMNVCGSVGIGSVAFSVLLNSNKPAAAAHAGATTASQ